MIKRIKKELKKLRKGARGDMTVGSHTHSHSTPGGGHRHTFPPAHNHQVSGTAMPFYDPSTGLQEEPFEWFHKVFCPCGSIDWIEITRQHSWSHMKGSNVLKKLVICKECEKVTVVDGDEISEQRDPIDTGNKFDFYEKVQELRIDFEQSQYARTSTTHTTTSTTRTTPPPPRGQ